jgi:hypothetical protein
MAKPKKAPPEATPPKPAEVDPQACLRMPANPPKPNWTAFLIALSLFLLWLAYLAYVAWTVANS